MVSTVQSLQKADYCLLTADDVFHQDSISHGHVLVVESETDYFRPDRTFRTTNVAIVGMHAARDNFFSLVSRYIPPLERDTIDVWIRRTVDHQQ